MVSPLELSAIALHSDCNVTVGDQQSSVCPLVFTFCILFLVGKAPFYICFLHSSKKFSGWYHASVRQHAQTDHRGCRAVQHIELKL